MGVRGDPAERRALRTTWIALAPIALVSAAPLLMDPAAAQVYSNVANPVIVALAAIFAFLFARSPHAPDARRTGWLFAIGLSSFAIAEVFWGYFNYTQPEADLDVSPADGYWLFAYGPLILAGALALRRYAEYVPNRHLLGAVAIWIVGFAVVIVPYLILVWESAGTTLAAAVFIAYPMLDYALMLALGLLALAYRSGRMGGYWLFLILATLALTVADLSYGIRQAQGVYHSGDFSDSLYILSYGLFAAVFAATVVSGVRYESVEPHGRYKVMEAFLLAPSGNVVASARNPEWKGSVDADVVGAMAGIVRNFAGSAFRDPKARPLDELSFGPLRLCYEGTDAGFMVVAATHGPPTEELRVRMRDALATLPTERSEESLRAWAEGVAGSVVKQ